LEDADGSLLILDTGSWYIHHCPTGKIRPSPAPGGIWRVRRAQAVKVDDPWGLKIDWAKASSVELAALLEDGRPAIRDRSQRALSARGREAVTALTSLLDKSTSLTARCHAVWALAAMPDDLSLPSLRHALRDTNPDLASTAARALARRHDKQSGPTLCQWLAVDPPNRRAVPPGQANAPLRLAAAEALTHCGDSNALPAIWAALGDAPDRFLEHALVHAAYRLADTPALTAALQHPQPNVQRSALLLLNQPPHPLSALDPALVLSRVAASDDALRQTALRVLLSRREWASSAATLARSWLENFSPTNQQSQALLSLLVAFQTAPLFQELLGSALKSGNPELQLHLLQTLAQTSLPKLPPAWIEGLEQCLHTTNTVLRQHTVRTIALLQVPALDEPMAQMADSGAESPALRLEALRAVVTRRPKPTSATFDFLLSGIARPDDPLTRLAAAEILRRSRLTDVQLLRVLKSVSEHGPVSASSLLPALSEITGVDTAKALLEFLSQAMRRGWKLYEEDLAKLLARLPPGLKAEGASLLDQLRHETSARPSWTPDTEARFIGGNAEQGRSVFFGKKAACATCHAVGQSGGQIGPDLTKIGAIRSFHDILESILLPSSTFAQGYEPYLATTTEGAEIFGLLARQSPDALTLRDASGAEVQLHRSAVRELRRLPVSLMPEGLTDSLSDQERRDLMAFLQSLR
jgi:putative heme-binding domain-containing protein